MPPSSEAMGCSLGKNDAGTCSGHETPCGGCTQDASSNTSADYGGRDCANAPCILLLHELQGG